MGFTPGRMIRAALRAERAFDLLAQPAARDMGFGSGSPEAGGIELLRENRVGG